MSGDRRSLLLLLVIALTMVTSAQAQSSATATLGGGAPAAIVGRWVLIATIRNGEDVTQAGVTQGGAAFVYDFKVDGTFSITRGERVARTFRFARTSGLKPSPGYTANGPYRGLSGRYSVLGTRGIGSMSRRWSLKA